MATPSHAPRTVREWVDARQASGRYVFTREDIAADLDITAIARQSALRRLARNGRIASPRRGFHVIVPLEYRAVGCPPASWFIDDLMRYVGCRYYVALLTAAALHGAAHQQPMVFQVIADRPIRPMRAGRVRIEVHTRRALPVMPTRRIATETGTMVVGTPETTAFDLVHLAPAAGHWNNVATVLSELADSIDPDRLVDIARHARLPDVQRLGYLLSTTGREAVAEPLARWLAERRPRVVRLRADRPSGPVGADPRWRVIPNESIEIDL